MVLSDRSIREEMEKGRLVIRPFNFDSLQPASVDIHLDRKLRVFRPWHYPHQIDLSKPLDGLTEEVEINEKEHFSLQPGQFVLGSTVEYIGLPDDLMARLEGKSSLGRIGLLIHSTAGYVDPGWKGHLTLELYNVCALSILLYAGMKISQISFHRLTTPAERPYGSPGLGSKYQDQVGPVPTRYHLEFLQPPPVTAPSTTSKRNTHALRAWLARSEFKGSARRLAEQLRVPLKTVEDWLYRGAQPGDENRMKVFLLTQLPDFAPRNQREAQLLCRIAAAWGQQDPQHPLPGLP